jgi:uncharacterized protein YyaL (SSP411 family)
VAGRVPDGEQDWLILGAGPGERLVAPREPVDRVAGVLAKAREEDRPILLSIGYSSCHWCHVMERESFEDPAVAAVMNEHFVSIKVDREERPDLDQVYMKAVQAMTGGGGWPMTVFLTAEGVPFYGGTYFPPAPRHGLPSFTQVLQAAADAYRNRGDKVRESGAQLVSALATSATRTGPGTAVMVADGAGAQPARVAALPFVETPRA